MKLEIKNGSENYACTVVLLPVLQDVQGLDNLKRVSIFGNDCLVGKESEVGAPHLFFPAECAISKEFLAKNNLYRDSILNRDKDKKGFFESSGRVKALKFKGVISTGFVIPISSFDAFLEKCPKVGEEFTTINGNDLCWKYKPVHIHATVAKESRFNKKLKRFDKLVPNQFRFHESTAHLAKNLNHLKEDDIIVITDKWHGTSAVFSNVLVNKELTWKDKVAKWFGVPVVDKVYDNLYSSRSVLKNQYINKEQGGGYYGEDIWATVNKELAGKIEQGITIYGEIVGYLESGKMIQKGYDYGCLPIAPDYNGTGYLTKDNVFIPQHKFVVYRITYTKPDGSPIEFSWQQIKDYCFKYQLETVPELYFGVCGITDQEEFLRLLVEEHLEKKCKHCRNDVWAEGIVLRIDGKQTFSAYKLKSKNFIEGETKELDKGEINIETEA
jgi:hypothetical protein